MEIFDTKIFQPQSLADIYLESCESSDKQFRRNINYRKISPTLLLAAALTITGTTYAVNPVSKGDIITKASVENVNVDNTGNSKFVEPLTTELGVNLLRSRDYRLSDIKVKEVNHEYEVLYRKQTLQQSCVNKEEVSFSALSEMHKINNTLSELNFKDALLYFNTFDDAWDYTLYFDYDIKLNFGVFLGEENEVDFNVYHKSELILSNILSLNELVSKMDNILKALKRNV